MERIIKGITFKYKYLKESRDKILKFIKLNKREQFENLKKGDLLLIKWSDDFIRHNDDAQRIMLYNIYQNKSGCHEIICRKKNNHYFNYNCFLEGQSAAVEVYYVINE